MKFIIKISDIIHLTLWGRNTFSHSARFSLAINKQYRWGV
jgi:hypothetical protein